MGANRRADRLSREELYERVWSSPMYKIAAEFGLSGPGLKKICERHEIPTPGRGYWQKLRHGKKAHRPPLPDLPDDQAHRSIRLGKPSSPSPPSDRQVACFGPVAEQRHFEDQGENRILVKDNLRGMHPLIRELRDSWKGGRTRTSGLRRSKRRPILNVRVSKQSRRRALLIMNALLKALEQRGYPVRVSDGYKNPTVAEVFGEDVEFYMKERRKKVEREPTPDDLRFSWNRDRTFYDLKWTGRLTLGIDQYIHLPRKSWTDGKVQRLENCLNDFVVALVAVGKKLQERTQRNRVRDLQRERERQQQVERERHEQLERERVEELKRQVEAWELSQTIRAYVLACRVSLRTGSPPSGPKLPPDEWLAWAAEFADQIDPFKKEQSEFITPPWS